MRTRDLAAEGWDPVEGLAPAVVTFEIDDLSLVDEFTHPIRGPIARALATPYTVAELAESLGTPVTRLYHHVHRLVERGLIRVIATRQAGAATERLYQAVAENYTINARQLQTNAASVAHAVSALFDSAKASMLDAFESSRFLDGSSGDQGMLTFDEFTTTPERYAEFLGRIRAVVADYLDDDGPARFEFFASSHARHRPA